MFDDQQFAMLPGPYGRSYKEPAAPAQQVTNVFTTIFSKLI